MNTETLFTDKPQTRAGITPRHYQVAAHDETFRLFDTGEIGVLERMATGTGKTLLASLIADTWLRRGDEQRVMVISYERQLVWQFADEIKDYIGITAGIEMDASTAPASDRIIVASRQSIVRKPGVTNDQANELSTFGIRDLGPVHKQLADKYLKYLRRGGDADDIIADIYDKSQQAEAVAGSWSRLHKFDWRLNWLVIFDEAHRHAYHLSSVGHVVDWFEQNPLHRRLGLTATPKRSDEVSLGDRMFPGIAIDYPLYSRCKACAVKDGYAVPYLQKYIEVEGVDFKSIKRASNVEGADFDEEALAAALGEEATLAKLVLPLLNLCGDRRFLIFSPSKQMSKDVACFINARVKATCQCGVSGWYSRQLIGDGAACRECSRFIVTADVTSDIEQARQLDGDTADRERKEVYRAHQTGEIQFLSVCGLCREGYNDADLGGVAVFRPVSKKASSLAEQMKGRAARPLRSLAKLLHTMPDAETRRQTIADSSKPNALIVDLVGITGLADCASTVEIYSEGLPDDVKRRAEHILTSAVDEEMEVEEAIDQAQRESDERKAKIQREREAAERKAQEEFDRRAKAQAEARYSEHEVGYGGSVDPKNATEGMYKFIRVLGIDIQGVELTKKQAGRMIGLLRARKPVEEVATLCGLLDNQWVQSKPSFKQTAFWKPWRSLPHDWVKTPFDYNLLRTAHDNPEKFMGDMLTSISKARRSEEIDAIAADYHNVAKKSGINIGAERVSRIFTAAAEKRKAMSYSRVSEEPLPE